MQNNYVSKSTNLLRVLLILTSFRVIYWLSLVTFTLVKNHGAIWMSLLLSYISPWSVSVYIEQYINFNDFFISLSLATYYINVFVILALKITAIVYLVKIDKEASGLKHTTTYACLIFFFPLITSILFLIDVRKLKENTTTNNIEIINQWTDENGYLIGVDKDNKYYYWANDQWVLYG